MTQSMMTAKFETWTEFLERMEKEQMVDNLEKMTKREFVELHRSGALGLLHAGAGDIKHHQKSIAEALEKSGKTMQSYLMPVTRADIDGSDTAVYEDYTEGIIYVYTSYKRSGDGAQIDHCTVYGRY